MDHHVAKLEELGVCVLTGRTVSDITCHGDKVNAVTLSDGRKIACDELVWTLPAVLLLRLSGVPHIKSATPSFRHVLLFHFVFDEPVKVDDHWITCYDEAFFTYRATLYPNITNDAVLPPPHRVTVETLAGEVGDLNAMISTIKSELAEMGVIKNSAKTLFQLAHALERALPVSTNEFYAAANAQQALAHKAFSNVRLFGHAGGGNKMIPLLREIWDQIGCADRTPPKTHNGR